MRIKLIAGGAAALLLSACGGTTNRGLETVHQPVVERVELAFDVATDGGGLEQGEAARLAGWLASLQLGYGDRISVADAGANAGVRDAVAHQAARYGLLMSDSAPLTVEAVAPGTARVLVSRMRASVPGCPDHSRISGNDLNANTTSNYGCAASANLAAMVARPEDLVRGQPGTGVDATANAKAVDSYRRAVPTGSQQLKNESTRGGN